MNNLRNDLCPCDADNIYLNVVISNNTSIGNGSPIVAKQHITRTQPLINNASNYYLSVIRFTIPLQYVPLFIVDIVPNQANPNLTPYFMGITIGATNYSEQLIYIPTSGDLPVPVQNQQYQVITPYYYVYAYDILLQMANTALAAAYIAAGSPGGEGAPFFIMNYATRLLSLVTSVQFINAGGSIFFNYQLIKYFDGFNLYRIGNLINSFSFITTYTINNYYPTPGTATGPPQLLQFSENYSNLEYWSSFQKLIITSNLLPVRNEYIPSFDQLTIDTVGFQNGVNAQQPIISDFVPNIEYANDSRTIAYYNPTSQYRLVDLLRDTPIYAFDIAIYWIDRNNNVYPLKIGFGQEATLKIGFFKKDLYKNKGLFT